MTNSSPPQIAPMAQSNKKADYTTPEPYHIYLLAFFIHAPAAYNKMIERLQSS